MCDGDGGYSGASSSLSHPAMKSSSPLSVAVAGALLAVFASGCATEESSAPAGQTSRSRADNTITGSHIPNKKPMPEQSDEERQRTVERMKELQERSQPPQKLPN